jgi:cytochrome c551/c552
MSLTKRGPVVVVLAILALLASLDALAAAPKQQLFPTAMGAAQALYEAARAGDRATMELVLGPGSATVIASGNEGEDMAARARFVAAFAKAARIEDAAAGRAQLVIGAEDWQFPYPLVKGKGGWRFDSKAGNVEVLARRIGRNELSAMQAVLAYVDAQREYALERHDDAGPGIYAQRIASTPGRHDGLYWTPTREDPLSPLGPSYTLAAADETGAGSAIPYHGYFFRVLLAQGARAEGGATDYVVRDRMIGGFALVAYPARYRETGVRTFIVSHQGIVFSRDLGANGTTLAHGMKRFDPEPGWRREAVTAAHAVDFEGAAQLASERGCTLCHREAPAARQAGDAPPLAPSWRDIAARYRGTPDAETRLTRTVLEGADPKDRHWKDRLDFTQMGVNAGHVAPDEARALVRWILSTP